MPKAGSIVGIDIGTTKVCVAVAEQTRNGSVRIVGVGTGPSKGIRKGVVVNIDEAVQSIKTVVDRAERVSGHKIVSAYLTISGGQITSLNNRGVIAVARSDRAVSPQDVDRALDAAKVINLASNREIVHAIPRHFIVDGQEGVKNPVGMVGYRIDVEAHIVTASLTAIQNLMKCVNRLGIDVDGIILEPLASGEAVLSEEEKEMGVVLVDIGGGSTGVAIYVEGSVYHTAMIPVGGNHVTNDIAIGMRMPFAAAEELKVTYAMASVPKDEPDSTVEIASFGRGQSERVSRNDLCEIVEARLVEVFSLVHAEIKNSGYDGLLPAGVVLTGGGAQIEGISDLASECLRLPTRVGAPWDIDGLADSVTGPAYAATVGLLQWEGKQRAFAMPEPRQPQRQGRRRDVEYDDDQEGSFSGRLKDWFRAFLP